MPSSFPVPGLESYLASLSPNRRALMRALRAAILQSLPRGYEERFEKGMISYEVPLTVFPGTYNGRPLLLAALASQKSFVTLYLMAVYADRDIEAWFRKAYAASGKQLNMGKSCVHFKTAEDVPFKVIRRAIARVSVKQYIKIYGAARKGRGRM